METSTLRKVRLLGIEELLVILLLGAITIRILLLYKRMKLYHQMNRHIEETEISLERLDKTIEALKRHILNLHSHVEMGGVNHKKRDSL